MYWFQPGLEHQHFPSYFLAVLMEFLASQEASEGQEQDLFLGDLQLPDIRLLSQI